jgi:hypothetical protein
MSFEVTGEGYSFRRKLAQKGVVHEIVPQPSDVNFEVSQGHGINLYTHKDNGKIVIEIPELFIPENVRSYCLIRFNEHDIPETNQYLDRRRFMNFLSGCHSPVIYTPLYGWELIVEGESLVAINITLDKRGPKGFNEFSEL